MSEEIKHLIETQGTAFEALKKSFDELAKRADVITDDRIKKIEKSLDDAVEAKAAIEAKLKAEIKEREELEAKLNRLGKVAGGPDGEKKAAALAELNAVLAMNAAEQKQAFTPLDMAGLEAYQNEFKTFMRKGIRPGMEIKTLSVGSDPDGGYFVTPDVSGRIVKKVYESSPIRQIANVQTITTDALEGIEDLGEAGAGYAGEHATSGDTTTPQVGKWRIPVFWIDTEPKATQQLLDDAAVDIEGWLADKVADKLARFETNEFITGAANKIRGMAAGYTMTEDTTGAGVTWGELAFTKSGTNGGFSASGGGDCIFTLIGLLKNDYLSNAVFLTRRSVITAVRKLKDDQKQYLWQPSIAAGTPEMLAGYPIVRAEDMPALATNSYSMAFGDFRQGYQIVDRQGIRVMRDPYTSKPYVKFYTTKRVGGAVVNFEAIKFMKFAA